MAILQTFSSLFEDKAKRRQLFKFLLLLGVLVAYFGYLSWQYGLASGGLVAALTWSFFVLCTPVADAGFLLDFPVRLITKFRMVYSEIAVWFLAFAINGYALFYQDHEYDKTPLTRLLHHILVEPWPFWGLIVLCMAGTFASVIFGDEVMDVAGGAHNGHKAKKISKLKIAGIVVFFGLIVLIYYHLINSLGIEKIINGG